MSIARTLQRARQTSRSRSCSKSARTEHELRHARASFSSQTFGRSARRSCRHRRDWTRCVDHDGGACARHGSRVPQQDAPAEHGRCGGACGGQGAGQHGQHGARDCGSAASVRQQCGGRGQRELGDAYASGDGNIQVRRISTTLPPFTPGSQRALTCACALRASCCQPGSCVSAASLEKTVAATAVAGPRTLNVGSTVCNVAPMMVCGNAGCAGGLWGYNSTRQPC